MDELQKHPRKDAPESLFDATTAVVLGQVGFFTLLIVLAAVGIGLWLDQRFDTLPRYTLILVIGSMPLSVFITFRTVKRALKRRAANDAPKELENGTD